MSLRRQQPASSSVSSATVLDPDGMLVLIDSFDGDASSGRAPWPVEQWPPSPTHLPATGDRCLVVRDQAGRVWVLAGDWTDPIVVAPTFQPGALRPAAVAGTPDGWALADGSACPAGDLHDRLVTAGYPYGRSGSDPRLPDLCGRTLIGAGRGQAGLTVRTAGTPVGTETHLLTAAELPTGDYWTNSGAFAVEAGTGHTFRVTSGRSAAHNNMQPSLPVYWLVKL